MLGTLLALTACGKSAGSSSRGGAGGALQATSANASATGTGTASTGSGTGGGPPSTSDCNALATLPVRTPTYFVDYAAGADTNDGKAQASAFKHAPGDASATGKAATVTLAAGDVVLLKGGVEYDGTIAITTSGTVASPIVVEGGAQQGWGAGRAIVDGQNTRSLGIGVSGASNVIVEGFELRNFDKTQGSTAIGVDGGSQNLVVGNQIHDVYYAKNPQPNGTSWEQQRGTGISVNNSPGTNGGGKVMFVIMLID